ncbi:MAG: aldo/keto reductase [Alphaproteobacteria bacterium]
MTVPSVEIVPGYRISQLIKGGWQTIGRGADAIDDLLAFVRAGVTTFETADSYAGGEVLMAALRGAAHQRLAPEVAEAVKIHTRFTAPLSGAAPTEGDVRADVERSLKTLGVERIDLVQIQWWNPQIPGLIDAAMVLTDLQREGKIELLGTCNLGVTDLRGLIDAGMPVATSQVLYAPIDRRAENAMADFCRTNGIALLTFAPLAGGFISDRWRGADDPASTGARYSKEYRALIEVGGGWARYQTLLGAFASIARQLDRPLATVALRWVLQFGPGQAILFGASSADRLTDLLSVFDFTLDEAARAEIDATDFVRSTLDIGEIERAPDSDMMRAIRGDIS